MPMVPSCCEGTACGESARMNGVMEGVYFVLRCAFCMCVLHVCGSDVEAIEQGTPRRAQVKRGKGKAEGAEGRW